MNKENEFRSGVVTLMGPANAGKSTLLNALVGAKVSIVSSKKQTTRTRILGIKTRDDAQILFIDTPGFMARRYRGALARFISDASSAAADDADSAVLVIDGAKAMYDKSNIYRVIKSCAGRELSSLRVVAINKIDLVESRDLLPLFQRVSQEFIKVLGEGKKVPEIVPVSAVRGKGLDVLEELIVSTLPHGPKYFPEEASSDQPEEFLAGEVIREKLMDKLGDELPYSIAVRVEGWRDGENLIFIDAAIFVERSSQKAIVIGQQGKKLKSVGQSARQELEKIFNSRIHLQLFVKVEPNWTRTNKGLVKAGYRANSPY